MPCGSPLGITAHCCAELAASWQMVAAQHCLLLSQVTPNILPSCACCLGLPNCQLTCTLETVCTPLSTS